MWFHNLSRLKEIQNNLYEECKSRFSHGILSRDQEIFKLSPSVIRCITKDNCGWKIDSEIMVFSNCKLNCSLFFDTKHFFGKIATLLNFIYQTVCKVAACFSTDISVWNSFFSSSIWEQLIASPQLGSCLQLCPIAVFSG